MRLLVVMMLLFCNQFLEAQDLGFECDGTIYILNYNESTRKSTIFKVIESNGRFDNSVINLSEDRRLTCLAYSVADKFIYALDVESAELIQINRFGSLKSLGVPPGLEVDYVYHGGETAPDGSTLFVVGNNPDTRVDDRFYSILLEAGNVSATLVGVSADNESQIGDFATDPVTGERYAYDNNQQRLAQVGIKGQIGTSRFPVTDVSTIDGLFFNNDAELFGYSAQTGYYAIDKITGSINLLSRGPEGDQGDACSCPYTAFFEKRVEPQDILPCQEFEVVYSFDNRLGSGLIDISFRDTFPEDFEIIDIKGDVVTSVNRLPSASNIVALDNLIYLMLINEIRITVRAPDDFRGFFSSQGVQWDFPFAFGRFLYTDDPTTEALKDPTFARVISQEDVDIGQDVVLSCDGTEAIITAPIAADEYQWSTGSKDAKIIVDQEGWYELRMQNSCVTFVDSIFITNFPSPKDVELFGPDQLILGETAILSSTLDRGIPVTYEWTNEGEVLICTDCPSLEIMPSATTEYKLVITDSDGCQISATKEVVVEQVRNFYAASAFSPNDDGINDIFFLQSSTEGVIKNMSVYNRWGNELYSNSNLLLNKEVSGWNGRSNNRNVDPGVYIWVAELEYFDGFAEVRSGNVTLMSTYE